MRTPKTAVDARTTSQVLGWARQTVDAQLRQAVDRLAEPTRTVAGYHFGWWDERGGVCDVRPGKALRPVLTLLCAEAVGVQAAQAAPAAAAVELVHNFSLLHDDVIDGDRTRRNRPTAWATFGVSAAILTGDAMLSLAFDILANHCAAAMAPLSAMLIDLCNGQAADIAFERRAEVSIEECVAMASDKTASLLGYACALGALAGDADTEQVERMRLFGHHLGLAFQLTDDLLGIWGDPAVTGKSVHSDLRARKKSLPVVAALTTDGEASRRLAELYLRPEPLEDAELATVASLIDLAGGRAWAEQESDRHIDLARTHLDRANPASEPAAHLDTLATLITRRDH